MGRLSAGVPSVPWRLWAMCGALVCLLGAGAGSAGAASPAPRAASPAPSAVTEVVERPFPLLVPLSYRWARGAAWMGALYTAAADLPTGARRGLAEAGLDDRAGLLALCTRLYTLGHLTQDDSPELVVAARLVPVADWADALAQALRETDLLALLHALLSDMEATVLTLQRQWPASLAEARSRATALEAASQRLEGLWTALMTAGPSAGGWACAPGSLPALERAVRSAPDTAALWLLLAEARLQRDLPQAAVAAAEEALGLLAGRTGPAAERLEARARYLCGLGRWRLGQPALAEADLTGALCGVSPESAPQGEERARRLRARGAVRMLRRNEEGMCEDFAAACALGDCEGLAAARARGYCRAGTPTGEGARGSEGRRP